MYQPLEFGRKISSDRVWSSIGSISIHPLTPRGPGLKPGVVGRAPVLEASATRLQGHPPSLRAIDRVNRTSSALSRAESLLNGHQCAAPSCQWHPRLHPNVILAGAVVVLHPIGPPAFYLRQSIRFYTMHHTPIFWFFLFMPCPYCTCGLDHPPKLVPCVGLTSSWIVRTSQRLCSTLRRVRLKEHMSVDAGFQILRNHATRVRQQWTACRRSTKLVIMTAFQSHSAPETKRNSLPASRTKVSTCYFGTSTLLRLVVISSATTTRRSFYSFV